MKPLKNSQNNKIHKAKIERLPEPEKMIENIPGKTAPQITPQQIQ